MKKDWSAIVHRIRWIYIHISISSSFGQADINWKYILFLCDGNIWLVITKKLFVVDSLWNIFYAVIRTIMKGKVWSRKFMAGKLVISKRR